MRGGLPGLGRKRTNAFRGDPRRGAADVAPTAPHATPPSGDDGGGDGDEARSRKSGPARFWRGRFLRLAFYVALALSLVVHGYVTQLGLLPDSAGIELKDPEGELTIPVDLLGEEAPPPEAPPPPTQAASSSENDPNGIRAKPDAAAPRPKPDAEAPDAEALATDAGLAILDRDGGLAESDGGAASTTDAGESDAASDAGLVASADAGAPSGGGATGPRDPGSMIGMAGLVAAGQINVTLLVNIAVIRQNPVGSRMGPLVEAVKQRFAPAGKDA